MKPIAIIPVPSALGAPIDQAGTAQGPQALRQAGLLDLLRKAGQQAEWTTAITPPQLTRPKDTAARWTALTQLCGELAARVESTIKTGQLPLVIGGDHAIAVGTWRGVANAVDGPIGLLWLDAHLDAHTPEDSASANPHGMPIALLLGDGPMPLARPTINPAHICIIGARSWELPERGRLQRYGVRIIDQQEITRRGLPAAMAEAMEIVSKGTVGFGISVDLDVFDPKDAPGVNSPVAGGLSTHEWFPALEGIACRNDCLTIEITECDGLRDRQMDTPGSTAGLACTLINSLVTDCSRVLTV